VTIQATCWCGAEISIDDASELAAGSLLAAFYVAHPHGHEPWSRYQPAFSGEPLPVIGA